MRKKRAWIMWLAIVAISSLFFFQPAIAAAGNPFTFGLLLVGP